MEENSPEFLAHACLKNRFFAINSHMSAENQDKRRTIIIQESSLHFIFIYLSSHSDT